MKELVLGVVQGVTEFLPVSSSGHLVLVKAWLGMNTPGALHEVVLHVGTLVAILVALRRDVRDVLFGLGRGVRMIASTRRPAEVWRQDAHFRTCGYLAIGSAPIAIVGAACRPLVTGLFGDCLVVGLALLFTGGLLWWTRSRHALSGRRLADLRVPDALVVGVAQAIAVVPGISRSGATISAGLGTGLNRDVAAHLGILLAIPAIMGALCMELGGLADMPRGGLGPLLVGGATSAAVGFFSLLLLLRVVHKGRLHWFAPYCWLFGVVALVTHFLQ